MPILFSYRDGHLIGGMVQVLFSGFIAESDIVSLKEMGIRQGWLALVNICVGGY
jgi:hypothetical protein